MNEMWRTPTNRKKVDINLKKKKNAHTNLGVAEKPHKSRAKETSHVLNLEFIVGKKKKN
jgi:hypothetical protein